MVRLCHYSWDYRTGRDQWPLELSGNQNQKKVKENRTIYRDGAIPKRKQRKKKPS